MFQTVDGCDSVVTLDLTINYSNDTIEYISICSGESYSVANSTYNVSGVYQDTLISSTGCETIIVTHLTVITDISADINYISPSLQASAIGGSIPYSFLWNTQATTPSIIPNSSGNYWVIVSDNVCTSDTAYFTLDISPIEIIDIVISDFKIFPNPTKGDINIKFTLNSALDFELRLIDIQGKVIFNDIHENYIGEYILINNISNKPKGIYFVKIFTREGLIIKKVVLQ
jgi:hypothetical protein